MYSWKKTNWKVKIPGFFPQVSQPFPKVPCALGWPPSNASSLSNARLTSVVMGRSGVLFPQPNQGDLRTPDWTEVGRAVCSFSTEHGQGCLEAWPLTQACLSWGLSPAFWRGGHGGRQSRGVCILGDMGHVNQTTPKRSLHFNFQLCGTINQL